MKFKAGDKVVALLNPVVSPILRFLLFNILAVQFNRISHVIAITLFTRSPY